MNPIRSALVGSKLSWVEANSGYDGMGYSTWITIAKVALRFIAGTGLIATFAILVGGSKGDDDDR
jgi:hypothetical protein